MWAGEGTSQNAGELDKIEKKGPMLVLKGDDMATQSGMPQSRDRDFSPKMTGGARTLNTDLVNSAVMAPPVKRANKSRVPQPSVKSKLMVNIAGFGDPDAPPAAPPEQIDCVKANIKKAAQSPLRSAVNPKLVTYKLTSASIHFDKK